MLNTRPTSMQTGMSLIEVMVGIAILGILMAIAVPSFQSWMRNTQIRNAADSVANGIQRARAEAVMRNANVEFNLGAGSSWTVMRLDPLLPPTLVESRASSEGSKGVVVVAIAADLTPAATITFGSLGTVVANANGTLAIAQVDFTSVGGDRNLRVVIGPGGNARMCDPHLSSGGRAC